MLAKEIVELSLSVAERDDQTAFRKLFTHFYPGLFSFALAYVKDRQEAEEIAEDVFVRLWENRKMLPAIRNLTYYLYVATKNASLNSLRKKKRSLELSMEEVGEDIAGLERTPEMTLISEEILQKIEAVIKELPPKSQLIFRLIKEEGLKYKEVAELLNISVKTVETQMSLSLSKITKGLQHLLPGLLPRKARKAE